MMECQSLLFSFEGDLKKDLVMKAKWVHLFPSRTQKLSTSAATIAGPAPVKTAHRQVIRFTNVNLFFVFPIVVEHS